MFKKIISLILIICIALVLTGCSQQPTISTPVPTTTPTVIYNVGQRATTDNTSFVIKRSGRVDAAVDKAHVVYGIMVEIHNYAAEEIVFDVNSIKCYAGKELCPIYERMGEQAMTIPIPANGTIEGWLYYKIPAMHDGLSFTYTYNEPKEEYIQFIFEVG